jgi:hypothetical protein
VALAPLVEEANLRSLRKSLDGLIRDARSAAA